MGVGVGAGAYSSSSVDRVKRMMGRREKKGEKYIIM